MSAMAETRSLLWLSCLNMGVGGGSVEARTVRKRKRKGAIIRQRDLVLADIRIIIHINYKTFKNKLIYYVRKKFMSFGS